MSGSIREIRWSKEGDNLVCPLGRIELRGHLYDALPYGELSEYGIPTRIVGLLDKESAVVWFSQVCESLGVNVVFSALDTFHA
jgi:hypothetical protein